jgi:hypothetical protein
VLGYAIAKAPGMDEKAWLAEALRGLTTDQREFFTGLAQVAVQRPYSGITAQLS